MSAPVSAATQQDLDLSDWTFSQAGTNAVDGPTPLPDGFSYLMSGGAPVIGYDPAAGFYGAALIGTAGQVVIAFEGTNTNTGNAVFTTAQAIADVSVSFGLVAPSYVAAAAFAETASEDAEAEFGSGVSISLTGYSLGGADAEYAGQQTGLPGLTFGAPGIATPAASGPTHDFIGYHLPSDNFANDVDYGDPVGNYASDSDVALPLEAPNITHYGQAVYVGSLLSATLLYAASSDYDQGESSPSPTAAAADFAAAAANLATAAEDFHPLANYAADLGLTLPGAAGQDTSAGEVLGGLEIPGLDIAAPGAVSVSGTGITITIDGQTLSLPLPGGTGETFSLTSDGQGGTLVAPGAASSGYVFAGQYGATIQGGSVPLYFVGGGGAVSVTGGSGNTTLVGSTGSTSVLVGGSGTNVITGGTGSSTLIGGLGASTLIGGTGSTDEFARGAAPEVLIGGAGASTIYGVTGSGTEQVFTGKGVAFAGLDGAADTVIGGSGASSVVGGSGPDVFGFINGHAGGSMVIAGLSPSDQIVFSDYSGDPITSEGVLDGSDLITLSDGTIILLQGIDHTVFRGLA